MSVPRSLSQRSQKMQEHIRRLHLPNDRVTKCIITKDLAYQSLQEAIDEMGLIKPMIYVPPTSPTATRLVTHFHEKITAHGSLPVISFTNKMVYPTTHTHLSKCSEKMYIM